MYMCRYNLPGMGQPVIFVPVSDRQTMNWWLQKPNHRLPWHSAAAGADLRG